MTHRPSSLLLQNEPGDVDPYFSLTHTHILTNTSTMQPGQQLSQIEKSVTHLLIATKQLLETLTQWSRHTATEGEVSDVYVRLGYEFNIACRAFNGIGVDTSDLGPVPELLRSILEETLSQEASSASLDRFLPRIRDIIITLLHGLKRKQQRLRAKQNKENASDTPAMGQATSSSSLNSGLTQMLEDVPSQRNSGKTEQRRNGSTSSSHAPTTGSSTLNGEEDTRPQRYSSMGSTRRGSTGGPENAAIRDSQRAGQRPVNGVTSSYSGSSVSSQSTSVLSPPSEAEGLLTQQMAQVSRPVASQRENGSYLQAPPPPPPKQQDALAALQRGGELERRASRRYSAYQISKHLGASPNGMPMLPPAQNTPIPNRGRDVRDSMNAVRTRGSGIYSQQQNSKHLSSETSPTRSRLLSNRISEESSQSSDSRGASKAIEEPAEDGKILANESQGKAGKVRDDEQPKMKATLSSPIGGVPTYPTDDVDDAEPSKVPPPEAKVRRAPTPRVVENEETEPQFIPEQSPQPGKELTLFLQYKSKIKKFVLSGGSDDLSVARLQLAFIEKFAWNTHNNGIDLPEIYIQDPVSGVRHELEDLQDVKDRCVLVLNVEALDEVKKHIDEGLGGLRRMVEGVRSVIDGQQTSLQRVSERQQEQTREMGRLNSISPAARAPVAPLSKSRINGIAMTGAPADQISGIRDLRQDLAVVRQNFTSLVSDMNTSMAAVTNSASSIKTMAIEGVMPNLDATTGRGYVNNGKKTLGEESEKIVNRVDDLQDVVEDLRKDVVLRGVRPLPRQLETVSKNISGATAELKKMQEFLRKEKPIWTKIWEKELELVCNDRDLLTMQEELVADLEDDLDKATQTFALVEQATKQQNLQSSSDGTNASVGLRSVSKGLAGLGLGDPEMDPMKAKDGVLGEVRALRPNHEDRLEAIERAEKARQRELETRREGEFTKEVAAFVEEGKLKKSGGVEEAERLRKLRDESNMRMAWQTQQDRAAGKGKEREADAAAAAAAEPEQDSGQTEVIINHDGSVVIREKPQGPPPAEERTEPTSPRVDERRDSGEHPLLSK